MKRKKQGKTLKRKVLAFALVSGMILQPVSANASSENMEISANVIEETSKPTYTVTVPSSVAMGSLSTEKDTVQKYEVRVNTTEAKGEIQVSAPETGVLYHQKNTLTFMNDFGTQKITLDEVKKANDTDGEKLLKGTLTIPAKEVANAKAGNYTGTTAFTISYKQGENSSKPDGV